MLKLLKESMTVTSVKLLNPIDPAKAQTLVRLATLAERLGVPMLMVGAYARDINFWHVHGIETARKTLDVDLTVQLANWAAFASFSEALAELGFSKPDKGHPEKHTDLMTGQEVDILPFGGISKDGKTITWPGERHPWSVIGLMDAFEHSLTIPVTFETISRTVRVASLPAIVLMKIVAMHDRPEDRKQKDSADIAFIIRNYLNTGAAQRFQDKGYSDDVLGIKDDLILVAAYLLGEDIGTLATRPTRDLVLPMLRTEITSHSRCPLAHRLSEEIGKGSFVRARQIISAMIKGMEKD